MNAILVLGGTLLLFGGLMRLFESIAHIARHGASEPVGKDSLTPGFWLLASVFSMAIGVWLVYQYAPTHESPMVESSIAASSLAMPQGGNSNTPAPGVTGAHEASAAVSTGDSSREACIDELDMDSLVVSLAIGFAAALMVYGFTFAPPLAVVAFALGSILTYAYKEDAILLCPMDEPTITQNVEHMHNCILSTEICHRNA